MIVCHKRQSKMLPEVLYQCRFPLGYFECFFVRHGDRLPTRAWQGLLFPRLSLPAELNVALLIAISWTDAASGLGTEPSSLIYRRVCY